MVQLVVQMQLQLEPRVWLQAHLLPMCAYSSPTWLIFPIAANLKADARLFSQGMPLHDPLAAAVAVDPSLVTCIDLPMKVELETGDFHGTRGRTIGDPAGLIDSNAPRIHVAFQVDSSRFVPTFTTRISTL